MGRVPRFQAADATFHIGTRGNRKQPIFFEGRDHQKFMEIVATVFVESRWLCRAWCLMPNHYHFLVETPRPNLSEGMERLNGWYARWFNKKHELTGHLFERRFYSGLIESEWHFLETWRYILVNPVRAGLCRDAGDWLASSYRATVGQVEAPTFLSVKGPLHHFGDELSEARGAFVRFVREAPPRLPWK